MAEMSIRDQIRAIEGMKQDLDECRMMMDDMFNEMSNSIKYLRGEGFSLEKEEDYRNRYFNPAKATADEVNDNIVRNHIRYLDEIIDDLEGILNA